MAREMLFFKGKDLLFSLFTFVYLYEPEIYEDNSLVKSFMDSIHCLGDLMYSAIRQAKYL